jgi:anti-sigma B factor antagonist
MTQEAEVYASPEYPAALVDIKEQDLSLRLETSSVGNAIVVHCHGRIVYRYEAAALSYKVAELLGRRRLVILDLQHVTAIDSAGLGELVALHMWARGHGCTLRLSGVTTRVHDLLRLTNLTSLLEVFATEEDAAIATRSSVA